jgi:hypothetical protein
MYPTQAAETGITQGALTSIELHLQLAANQTGQAKDARAKQQE